MARTVSRLVPLLLLVGAGAMTGCAAFSDDPRARSPGAMIDDQLIETMVKRRIWNSDPAFDSAHLEAASYNGVLLLAGEVASAELKRRAEEIARGLDDVRRVHNELKVGGPLSMLARTNDTWLTTKVKARMLAAGDVPARRIKVVTSNGVVYLMGMLPREQADLAVEVVRSVYGVQKIVKIFEYL